MLFMAPEGTCGDGHCILLFRRGAFVPGVPVLPVLLKYDTSCHNPAWTLVNVPFSFVGSRHDLPAEVPVARTSWNGPCSYLSSFRHHCMHQYATVPLSSGRLAGQGTNA